MRSLPLMPIEREILSVAGREVAITNSRKVLFPQAGYTKLDLARYYLAVSDGALRGAGGRPNVLVRYPSGVGGEFFYQKRAPHSRPPWFEGVELHPHPVRAGDLDHPDELRVDLDPVPGVAWTQIREVAGVVRATLDDFGLVGW